MESAIHTAAGSAASPFAYWAACIIFVVCLAMIVFEKIHKTKVALFGAALVLLLSIVSQEEAFHSMDLGIDYNVIFLLISMMILVGILGRTGVFQWTAVKLAKWARGRPMIILVIFIIFTAIFSALLDNVTTVLLFVPVTLLVADELELDPTVFLVTEALAANIGGTATLIGDPPNLMIASRSKLTFLDFLLNLGPPVALMMLALLAAVWLLFRRKLQVDDAHRQHIMSMNETRLIKDPVLAKKSIAVLGLTVVGFALHGVLGYEPATVALAGAALLLLFSRLDPQEILREVEWPTVFFFIGLYVMIGAVVKVGIIADLSRVLIAITEPSATSMHGTALILMWFSALVSGVVDNIPYVATMAPLVTDMARTVLGHGGGELPLAVLHSPVLLPVWWSLALGACLGGNATPIGASANLVVLGIAERSGHRISFPRFMAYGLPTMILTLVIASIYITLRYY